MATATLEATATLTSRIGRWAWQPPLLLQLHENINQRAQRCVGEAEEHS